jgi:hypothetical protein
VFLDYFVPLSYFLEVTPMKKLLRQLFSTLKRWHESRGIRYVQNHQDRLEGLPFFHSLYFGGTAHTCPGWKSSDGMFHSDAPIAIVVSRGGKVSGVIGFEILKDEVLVRQLQGAPRGNFHDNMKVEVYLLSCTEAIAQALNMKAVWIVTPETAIAYRMAAPESDRPSVKAEMHMRKIYSYPAIAGYPKRFCWRVRRPTFYRALS